MPASSWPSPARDCSSSPSLTPTSNRSYFGLDLTSSDQRPSACALLDARGRVGPVRGLHTNREIIELVERERPALVAIDAPLFLPKGWDCLEWPCPTGVCPEPPWRLRAAERALYREGIGVFATTKKSIIKPMVYRAIALHAKLEALGRTVIEVYPYASKVRLFGRPIPRKTTKTGRDWLRLRLEGLLPGLAGAGPLGHDELDALVAAYTALAHDAGRSQVLGEVEEGLIVLPAESG